jgi:hypothetical protein
MSATVDICPDGTITIRVTGSEPHPAAPGECDLWTVFGVMHAGEPEPLAVVVGGNALAYRNDRWQGGVWEETVTADGPREAARQGTEQARARLADAPWPARGAA